MDVLTRERAKPALPYGGVHRLIDFALSGLVHADLADVWVSLEYQVTSIDDYLSGGRPWSLDRNRGGFRRIVPQTGTGPATESGFAHGNGDLLLRMSADIATFGARTLVVCSADHVFNMDLAPVDRGARRRRPGGDGADQRGVQEGRGRQRRRARRAATAPSPASSTSRRGPRPARSPPRSSSTTPRRCSPRCRTCAASSRPSRTPRTRPTATAASATSASTCCRAWWRPAGRPRCRSPATGATSASRASTSSPTATCCAARSTCSTTRAARSSRTGPTAPRRGSARRGSAATRCSRPGADVAGLVVGSVLGPGVVVEKGAEVHDSVVMEDCVIRAGAVVRTSVLDERCEVARPGPGGRGARAPASPTTTTWCWSGRDSRVAGTVAAGARLEPGTGRRPARLEQRPVVQVRRGRAHVPQAQVAVLVDRQVGGQADVERPRVGRGDVVHRDLRSRGRRRPAPPTSAAPPYAGWWRRAATGEPSAST